MADNYPEKTVKENIRLIESIMDRDDTSPSHRLSIVRKIPKPLTTADIATKGYGAMRKHLKMQRSERKQQLKKLKTIYEDQISEDI